MRARTGIVAAAVPLLTFALLGCGEPQNLGRRPPEARFFFPSGVLLDPIDRGAAPDPEADPAEIGPRYLFVANGNNDRTYNAGTVVAIDLRAFWRAWYDPERGGADPYCHEVPTAEGGTIERCVQPPGTPIEETSDTPPARPCRRLPLASNIVECDERPFVAASVHVGDFATTLTHSLEVGADGEQFLRLWLPVRGDPSITYIDVLPAPTDDDPGAIRLSCDQDPDDPLAPELCGDRHRLDALRNDPELEALDREPFNMVLWERGGQASPDDRGRRLGFVAHAAGEQLSLVDLDGVRGDDRPALVDLAEVYRTPAGAAGGFGLAVRPCFEAGQGPLGEADPEPSVPTITQGCTRPLVYTSFRFVGRLASFTASGLLDADLSEGRYCATTERPVGEPGAIACEPRIRGSRQFFPSLLLGDANASGAVLGSMAFADPRGDQLLVLQTNPGALLSLDTSIGPDGEPLDIPSAPPVEICAEPTMMRVYTEPGEGGAPAQRYAIISCFRAALVYVVDLEALRVVDALVVGTGPHDIVIDEAREVAYVINNLEFSVSVIDLSRRRGTRFKELARLGLQDPFSQ